MDIEAMNLILFFIHKTTSDLSRIDEKLILDKFFFFELGDALDISNEEVLFTNNMIEFSTYKKI